MEHIIWSNFDVNIADYADFLQEEYPEVTDPDKQYELCCDMNYAYLDDEKANLDMELPNPIICIADLGRWNGRSMGYKMIESGNISDCLYDPECDYCTWYVDRYNDLCFSGAHHDGTNHYLYRVYKDNVSQAQKDRLKEKIYNGTATRADIVRVTRRLGDEIGKVYGWSFPTRQKERGEAR